MKFGDGVLRRQEICTCILLCLLRYFAHVCSPSRYLALALDPAPVEVLALAHHRIFSTIISPIQSPVLASCVQQSHLYSTASSHSIAIPILFVAKIYTNTFYIASSPIRNIMDVLVYGQPITNLFLNVFSLNSSVLVVNILEARLSIYVCHFPCWVAHWASLVDTFRRCSCQCSLRHPLLQRHAHLNPERATSRTLEPL